MKLAGQAGASGQPLQAYDQAKPDLANSVRPPANLTDGTILPSSRRSAFAAESPMIAVAPPVLGRSPTNTGELNAVQKPRELSETSLSSELGLGGLINPTSTIGQDRPLENVLVRQNSARLIGAQMADALVNIQGSKVDISLNPAELGRVRMALSTTESGISVLITAERPETLDLMRRHIAQLTDEFRKLGYVDIGFEFSGGQAGGGPDRGSDALASSDETGPAPLQDAPDPNSEPATTTRPPNTRGLDLRL